MKWLKCIDLNIMPAFVHGLACLSSRFYYRNVRNAANKQNFLELETNMKTREEQSKVVLLGSLKSGTEGSHLHPSLK